MIKTTLFILFCIGFVSSHEYHVSVCNINLNSKKQTLEVTHRIFADDLENTLKAQKIAIDILNEDEYAMNNPYLKQYIQNTIKVKIDGQVVKIDWVGHEVESDQVVCYYEVKLPNNVDEISMYNSVLLELFPDQQNIVHWKKDNQSVTSVLLNRKKLATNQKF